MPDIRLCSRVFSGHYFYLGEIQTGMPLVATGKGMEEQLQRFPETERGGHKSCSPHLIGGLYCVKSDGSGVRTAVDDASITRKKVKEVQSASLP